MDDVRGRFLGLPQGTTPAAETTNNKQIQRIYVPRQDFFFRNKESSENVKIIRGVTLTRYILCTYVDSNNA